MELDLDRQLIAETLRLDPAGAWSIIDREAELALIHYERGANLEQYGHLRGLVVDTRHKVVVCQSAGHSPVALVEQLKLQQDGSLELLDLNGVTHSTPLPRCSLKMGFEGVVIRVFKHHGTVYWCTHKRLRPGKSRWGESDCFLSIYQRLGGPTGEQLFPDEVLTSPWCYTFLLVDPKLLVGTKQHVGSGYIVLLGISCLWDFDSCPFSLEELGQRHTHPAHLNTVSVMPAEIRDPFLFLPPTLTLEEANIHLRDGFYQPIDCVDKRLLLGEFLVAYLYDESGGISRIIKIISPAYHWRSSMRDDNANLLHRFYDLTTMALLGGDESSRHQFRTTFPLMPLYDEASLCQQLAKLGHILYLDERPLTGREMRTQTDRIHLIWICFLLSVPPQQQHEVAGFLTRFMSERESLVGWLSQAAKQGVQLESARANSIIKLAHQRSHAQHRDTPITPRKKHGSISPSRSRPNSQPPQRSSLDDSTSRDCLDSKMRAIVISETGRSLFRLVKSMRQVPE